MSHVRQLSIFAAAREVPDRIGLVAGEARCTFAELAALAAGRAASLGDCAGPLLLQPRLDLDSLLWLYAAFATGTPIVAVDPLASAPELAAAQSRTGARQPPNCDAAARAGTASFPGSAGPSSDARGPFSMLLTSGSTGAPKIVVMSRAAVLASAAASARNLGVEDDDRWLLCLSLSHVAGLAIVVRTLVARRTVVLFEPGPAGLLTRIGELGQLLALERVTVVSLVPVLLERLLASGFQVPATLRAVLLGGAACSPQLAQAAQRAGVPLITSYGLTETGSQIAARRYEDRHDPLPQRSGRVSSGHTLDSVAIKITDGRISLKTPSLFSGYLGSVAPPVDADGWFVTNDRGEWGPQGELYVVGRTDALIITGAENVDPEEVEQALRLLPEVRDACVFGIPCREFGERVVAVIVPVEAGLRCDRRSLRLESRMQLARGKLPRAITTAEALPLTAAGKLDRRRCKDRFIASFDTDPDGAGPQR